MPCALPLILQTRESYIDIVESVAIKMGRIVVMTNLQRLKNSESTDTRKIAKGPGLDGYAVRHLSRGMTLPFRLKKRSKRLESAAPLPRKSASRKDLFN